MATRGGTVWAVSIVPLGGYSLAVEGSEGLEEVVVDDVAFEFLLHPVPRGIRINERRLFIISYAKCGFSFNICTRYSL